MYHIKEELCKQAEHYNRIQNKEKSKDAYKKGNKNYDEQSTCNN